MVERIVRTYGRRALKGIGKRTRIALCRAHISWPFPKLINLAECSIAASWNGHTQGGCAPLEPRSQRQSEDRAQSDPPRARSALIRPPERVEVGLALGLSTGAQINLAKFRVQRFLCLYEHINAQLIHTDVAYCEE